MAEKINDSGPAFSIGEVFRDTYGDTDARTVARCGLNKRTIRIIAVEPDGRYLAELLTNSDGTIPERPRNTRVSAKTLRSGYVTTMEGK